MPHGLKDIELTKLNEVFAANERIERVVLYGSRAKGNYKPFSDVDITLEGAELTHTDLNRISLAIDDLLLPYQFDISIFHTLKNEALIDHIRRMGITIYEKKSEWKEYKLGDVATFAYGKLPKKELLGKGNYITFSGYKYVDSYPEYNCEKGDVILVARGVGGTGDVKLTMQRCFLTNLSIKIVLDNSIVLNDYFYNMFRQENLRYLDSGSAQSQITIQDLGNVIIEVPSVNVQRKVSAILSSIDDKIDLLHRENATLEQMAETLFRQWFVVEAKEEWEEGKLGDVLTVKGGTTPSTKESSFWNGEIAWTSPRDVTTMDGLYLFETEKKITQKGLEQINSGLLPSGTLLMSSRAPVGVLAFAEIPLAINQGYIAIIDDKGYPKEFIYLWLKANMDLVHSYSNGSTFMEISKSAFKSLDISIPSKNEVECFVQEVKPYFEKIRTNEIQIRTLTKTRDGLLPRLMGGEVKIL